MINYDNKKWLSHLFAWRGTVVANVLPRVIFFMLWTSLVIYLYHLGYIPKEKQIDPLVYNVVGLALGLLLVFRTNTSYDRFWEGRKLLGSNVNSFRNISQLLNSVIPKENKKLREEFVELIAVFNHAVKDRLRDGVTEETMNMLRPEFKETVKDSDHVPNTIMRLIQERITDLKVNSGFRGDPEYKIIMAELGAVTGNMGGMERIRFTPIPFAYASHLQLFIMIYFLALPFGMFDKLHWLAVPVVGIISVVLLGINEIGVEIEDPFGDDPNDLPVDTICVTIEKNVKEILL
ncbi:MAG: bestrophin family protein [Bacteroidota bacterium]